MSLQRSVSSQHHSWPPWLQHCPRQQPSPQQREVLGQHPPGECGQLDWPGGHFGAQKSDSESNRLSTTQVSSSAQHLPPHSCVLHAHPEPEHFVFRVQIQAVGEPSYGSGPKQHSSDVGS
jgi:hypothetical protein